MPIEPTKARTSTARHGEWFQSWNPEPEYLRSEGGLAHVPRQSSLEKIAERAEAPEQDDETR